MPRLPCNARNANAESTFEAPPSATTRIFLNAIAIAIVIRDWALVAAKTAGKDLISSA